MDSETEPFGVINSYTQGRSYVVQYDEDLWNNYDKDRRDFCFERWARKAEPLGAVEVVLQLVPDPLFPSGTHKRPYIARTEPIAPSRGELLKLKLNPSVDIEGHAYAKASEEEQLKLRKRARAMMAIYAPCNYKITHNGGQIIEQGKL